MTPSPPGVNAREPLHRVKRGAECDDFIGPGKRHVADKLIVFRRPFLIGAQVFDHRRKTLDGICRGLAPSPVGIRRRGITQHSDERRRCDHTLFERGQLVQVTNNRWVIIGRSAPPHADAPGERAQFIGGRFDGIDTGKRMNLGPLPLRLRQCGFESRHTHPSNQS